MQMQQLHITRTIPTVKTVFGNRCAVDNQVMTRGNGIRQMNLRGNRPATMIKAVAQEPAAAIPSPSQGENEWYGLVASADFYFNSVQQEALAEQLRELKRYYEEKGREIDFFFVSEPAWLEKFPSDAKRVARPCVALVSTDKAWITFMKLRLDRVLKMDLGKMDIDTATKSTAPVPELKPKEAWIAPYSQYAPGWWEVFMRN